MTSRELNREFAKLMKERTRLIERVVSITEDAYYKRESYIKDTLATLYRASDQFKYCNARSVLIFIYMNNVLRAVPFHQVFVKQELLS